MLFSYSFPVAPLVGAWIEIHFYCHSLAFFTVAPLVGAWIEIYGSYSGGSTFRVAPLVGAWIEIIRTGYMDSKSVSLPLWERGLKYGFRDQMAVLFCRSPCGSVD